MKNPSFLSQRPRGAQRGVTLVVALVILVIVTLLALTTVQISIQEERMAGNARDRQLAFEAAEYGLRAAQAYMQSPVLPAFTSTGGALGGLFTQIADGSKNSYWLTTHDWSSKSIAATSASGIVGNQAQPRYVIEEFPAVACDGYTKKWPPPPPRILYRLTARGTGQTTDAVVILQAWYDRGCN